MTKSEIKFYQARKKFAAVVLIILVPLLLYIFSESLVKTTFNELVKDAFVSLTRIIIAYGLAAVAGWFFAVVFYKDYWSKIMLPLFDVLQSFPVFAVLPLAVAFWGHSNFIVIFFLIISIIWPVFFSVVSSMKLIRRDWEEAVSMANLSRGQYLAKFLWPVSIPGLVTGSIIGLGDGWEALIATEIIVGVKSGLGIFFNFFSGNPKIITMGILFFLILIFTINKILWSPLLEWSHGQLEE